MPESPRPLGRIKSITTIPDTKSYRSHGFTRSDGILHTAKPELTQGSRNRGAGAAAAPPQFCLGGSGPPILLP